MAQPPSSSLTISPCSPAALQPYSPELNPVENVQAYLRANHFAISVFESYDDIVDACRNA